VLIIWGLGIGDWGLGPIPNPQSPIPNPQSPIPKEKKYNFFNLRNNFIIKILIIYLKNIKIKIAFKSLHK